LYVECISVSDALSVWFITELKKPNWRFYKQTTFHFARKKNLFLVEPDSRFLICLFSSVFCLMSAKPIFRKETVLYTSVKFKK